MGRKTLRGVTVGGGPAVGFRSGERDGDDTRRAETGGGLGLAGPIGPRGERVLVRVEPVPSDPPSGIEFDPVKGLPRSSPIPSTQNGIELRSISGGWHARWPDSGETRARISGCFVNRQGSGHSPGARRNVGKSRCSAAELPLSHPRLERVPYLVGS